MTPQEVENRLKRYWKVQKLVFVAQYTLLNRRVNGGQIGCFTDCRHNDRTIIYPPTEGLEYSKRISLEVPHQDNLIPGQYYLISAKPAVNNRSANPFLIEIDEIFETEGYDSPEEFIKQWFYRKGENPDDAATIASQLKLNQLELYTQTERFIFELLQNADDMPAGEGKTVEVFMKMLNNHFLFLHNGKFFDRGDVMAIADAAQSTKSKDKTQTGYKGIGFKSVFTDSSRVYIKSGDYSFMFDKLSPIYSNFEELYRGYLKKLTPEAQEVFKRNYAGHEAKYTQIERIPWQIKPIWVNRRQFPAELLESEFGKNINVAIALEIGESIFIEKEYKDKISNLLKEPRFLLFLRNLNDLTFESYDVKKNLRINREKSILEISVDQQIQSRYLRSDYEVTISSHSFKEAGLEFERIEVEEGKFEFIDDQGKRIENIPEKLAFLDKTVLAFAAQIDGDGIVHLPKDEAILFNYLPTSDKRFEFPFLVNGDFVTKTDREFILHENIWNQYLFFYIGYYHVRWLREVSMKRQFLTTYLNLLTPKLKDESDQQEGKINAAFNRGVKKAINEIAFIKNEMDTLSKCSEVVWDRTGLSNILGPRFFHAFTGINKYLPDVELSPKTLGRRFLGIECYEVSQLIDHLKDSNKLRTWSEKLSSLSEQEYLLFLDWLEKLCTTEQELKTKILQVPFLRFPSGIFSPTVAFDQPKKVIHSDKVAGVKDVIRLLGFEVTEFAIDKFPEIKRALVTPDNYLGNDIKLYEKILNGNFNAQLTGVQKVSLIRFFATLYGVGQDRYANQLALFKDKNGNRKPLSRLIAGKVSLPNELTGFHIDETEEADIVAPFSGYLIQSNNLFSKVLLEKTFYDQVSEQIQQSSLAVFTNFIIRAYDQDVTAGKDSQTSLNAIPWIFSDESGRFKKGVEVFCPNYIRNIGEVKYSVVRPIVEHLTGLVLPDYVSITLINKFKLTCRTGSIVQDIKSKMPLTSEQCNTFLDVLLKSEFKEPLFQNWQFAPLSDGRFEIQPNNGKRQFFVTAPFEEEFYQRPELQKILTLLPKELYQESLGNLDLLEGEPLFTYLIPKYLWLDLVQFREVSDSLNNKVLFLHYLPSLTLNSGKIYGKGSSEHKVVDVAMSLAETHADFIKKIRDKISVNGESFEAKALSDDVRIKVGEVIYELSLSQILPVYKGQSDIISAIVRAFPDHNELDLRKHIFPYHNKSFPSIESEIKSTYPEYIAPAQIVFLQLLGKANNRNDTLAGLKMYHDFYKDTNLTEVVKGNLEYINLVYNLKFYDWAANFKFLDFEPSAAILSSENIITSEKLPTWLEKWINESESVLKIEFLKKSGVNDDSSLIVKFRSALKVQNLEEARVWLYSLENSKLLYNSLEWLTTLNDDQKVTFFIEVISKVLDKVNPSGEAELIIPVVKAVRNGQKIYGLQKVKPDTTLYALLPEWANETGNVMGFLSSEGAVVIDESIPEKFRKVFDVQSQQVRTVLEESMLEHSTPFDAGFYENWVEKEKYPILIYPDDAFPWVVYLGQKVIRKYKMLDSVSVSGKYYVCAHKVIDLPYGLPHDFPADKFRVLAELQRRHNSGEPEEEEVITDNTYQLYRKIIKGKLDMQIESQLAYNKFAIQNGVVYLNERGFDFENATLDDYGWLANIYHSHSRLKYRFFFRSALGGLLFLSPFYWNSLGNTTDDMINALVVIYPGKGPQVFLNKSELLNQRLNEMILVRSPNNKNSVEIDRISNSLPDESHIIFFTSERHKSLYSEQMDRQNNNPLRDRATTNPDDFLKNMQY